MGEGLIFCAATSVVALFVFERTLPWDYSNFLLKLFFFCGIMAMIGSVPRKTGDKRSSEL